MMSSFMWGGGFDAMFMITFLIIIGIFVFGIVKGIGEWNKNNHSPRLTVDAKVVTKRTHTSHNHNGADQTTVTSTSYYVTFEVESGDRIEFHVSGHEYGMLAEGDQGSLTFQGTRYLEFRRI